MKLKPFAFKQVFDLIRVLNREEGKQYQKPTTGWGDNPNFLGSDQFVLTWPDLKIVVWTDERVVIYKQGLCTHETNLCDRKLLTLLKKIIPEEDGKQVVHSKVSC